MKEERSGFTNIWNTAYDKYVEEGAEVMWEYLRKLIDMNNISQADAFTMVDDIIATADL